MLMIDPTFIDTITLYNHYTDNSDKPKHKWGRIVLKNCYFGKVTGKNSTNLALTDADAYVCRIPKSPFYVELYQGNINTFSLAEGDVIVKGEVSDEISDTAGNRPADIIKRYSGNAFQVKNVSINTHLPFAQHYRASGS
jgi:hypothetical protein